MVLLLSHIYYYFLQTIKFSKTTRLTLNYLKLKFIHIFLRYNIAYTCVTSSHSRIIILNQLFIYQYLHEI